MVETCSICGCLIHRHGDYALSTTKGRSHATKHHYIAERFFGRSGNRKGTNHNPIFSKDPWGIEGQAGLFCYECHEELLHNPVLLPSEIKLFAQLVKIRNLNEQEKPDGKTKIAGRIELLQEVIRNGLNNILD